MRKYAELFEPVISPEQLPGRHRRLVWIVALCLVLTPIGFEYALRLHARWRTILGETMEARTPILNWIEIQAETLSEKIRYIAATDLPQLKWKFDVMMPIVAGILVFAMLLMRRSHNFR
jgi:hypothetical protein